VEALKPSEFAPLKRYFIFLTLVLLSLACRAENWPRFRGPTGQGISTEKKLPLEWTATSNVLWKTPVPGEGWSSPIVWNNRVFLTTTTENGTQCRVLCFDRRTGQVLWNKHLFDQVPLRKEGKNSYASATPVTDGKRVVAVFGDGSMVALSLDGSILWTNREVQFYSRHGLGASPMIYRDLVIMPFDGSNRVKAAGQWPNNPPEERLGWQIPWDQALIAALDLKTGRRIWTGKRGMSRIAHASPILFRHDGKDQLLSIAGDAIQAFDPKTGERLWSAYAQGEGLVPSPVIGDGLIFAASGFEKTTLRAIRPGGKGDVTATHIVWEQKKGVPTQPSLVYVRPHLFAITDGGVATCYKADSGDIVWQERVGGNFSASPVYADGRIYFLSEAGETTVIAAGPEFKILARNALGEKCQASMAVSQGQLYLRSEKNLFCIGQKMAR
jgi:outer membrane protein assembly factor BamB